VERSRGFRTLRAVELHHQHSLIFQGPPLPARSGHSPWRRAWSCRASKLVGMLAKTGEFQVASATLAAGLAIANHDQVCRGGTGSWEMSTHDISQSRDHGLTSWAEHRGTVGPGKRGGSRLLSRRFFKQFEQVAVLWSVLGARFSSVAHRAGRWMMP